MSYVCVNCQTLLEEVGSGWRCTSCALEFPVENGISDFSGGAYYDSFVAGQALSETETRGLDNEVLGTTERVQGFYLPLLKLRTVTGRALRVLDSGCGNGISVDILRSHGIDAWGSDLSALRKWQWQKRTNRRALACASGFRLPFADRWFDAVVSSGVLEHIGVAEQGGLSYRVTPNADQLGERRRFLAEHGRVLDVGGTLYLDFPNGACPVDFWHGSNPGAPRFHSAAEQFLPTLQKVRQYFEGIPGQWSVRPIGPFRRLEFHQVRSHWWGRILAPAARLYLRLLSSRAAAGLLGTGLNPFLVVAVTKRGV